MFVHLRDASTPAKCISLLYRDFLLRSCSSSIGTGLSFRSELFVRKNANHFKAAPRLFSLRNHFKAASRLFFLRKRDPRSAVVRTGQASRRLASGVIQSFADDRTRKNRQRCFSSISSSDNVALSFSLKRDSRDATCLVLGQQRVLSFIKCAAFQ